MKIKILQSAESEIADGMDYYNKQYPGLGYEFATEIKKSITAIKSYPKAWAKYHDDFRKCFVNRFPYAVLYELRKESIIMVPRRFEWVNQKIIIKKSINL